MRVASVALAALCATSQAFSPMPLSNQATSLAIKRHCGVFEENDHNGYGRRFRRTGKAWTRHVAAVALASLAFRQPRPADASTAVAVPPMAFQSEMPVEKVATNEIPVATAVIAAGGAGAAVAKYIIKRGDKADTKEDLRSKEVGEMPSIETQESPPVVEVTGAENALKERKLIANLLEKVKDAEKKVLVAAVSLENSVQKASQIGTVSPAKPDKVRVEYTSDEKMKIVNNVFDCHGFFPDLRGEDELPPEIRLMRKQPKSESALSSIKSKYAAISDESERVYTMLVDLGMMESYDHLAEYSDDFDETEDE